MKAKRLGLVAAISVFQLSMGVGCGDSDSVAKTSHAPVAAALTASGPTTTQPRSVTLITGDQVVVSGNGNTQAVSIRPASGRTSTRFLTQRLAPGPGQDPHLYVIPEDALPLIAGDKVDRRLFDV